MAAELVAPWEPDEPCPEPPKPDPPKVSRRGTTNGNVRGNSTTRLQRRIWLVETYRANVDASSFEISNGPWEKPHRVSVPLGSGEPACRCYRCAALLTVDTVTADRIKPGRDGGKYRTPRQDDREGVTNIRPACLTCNSETGGKLPHERRKR